MKAIINEVVRQLSPCPLQRRKADTQCQKLTRLYALMLLCFFFVTLQAQQKTGKAATIKVEAKRWVKGDNNQPWSFYDTRLVESLPGYNCNTVDKDNLYGSDVIRQTDATGFFRVEKINNRWWVIDPSGHYNIQRVINGFRKGGSERNANALESHFGSDKKWVDDMARTFNDCGINGTGSWSTDSLIRQYNEVSADNKLSYSPYLGLMSSYGRKRGGTYQLPGNTGFPNQTIFVFDPEFKSFCDSVAAEKISELSGDPNLFGYFSDNELPFGLGNLEGYLTLKNPADPGRIAAERWLKERGVSSSAITDRDRAAFAGYVADRYFKIVSEAIKKADKNHLYLGSRLHGKAKFIKEVMQAAGKYCDVVSINYYGVWTPSPKHLADWKSWFDRPFIITEFYTKGMDSGLANTTGAGYTVHTQKDRGYSYQDFCLALLEAKNCVGWHYFKYQDNDPEAKNVDPSNVDSNKGIVNNDYQFYEELINSMKLLNRQVYSLVNYFDN